MKWHQTHTTWFFETFVLRPFLPDYKPFREEFRRLFNGYYNSLGEEIPEKHLRASLSRPPLAEVLAFRTHVDEAVEELFAGPIHDDAVRRIVLGLNHEQQHQELMLTDIKHAFFSNSLRPAYDATPFAAVGSISPPDFKWHHVHGGVAEIGYCLDSTDCLDFCFDNETPSHKVYKAGASSPCEVGIRFLRSWIHRVPCELFLRPMRSRAGRGCRLPNEMEWELAADGIPNRGNMLDTGRLHPTIASGDGLDQLFGDAWEWTASPYTGYPGYKPLPGALGEYNGKFMSAR